MKPAANRRYLMCRSLPYYLHSLYRSTFMLLQNACKVLIKSWCYWDYVPSFLFIAIIIIMKRFSHNQMSSKRLTSHIQLQKGHKLKIQQSTAKEHDNNSQQQQYNYVTQAVHRDDPHFSSTLRLCGLSLAQMSLTVVPGVRLQ